MRCAAKKNEHFWALIKRAKANLRTCIAQNEKRLTFPELFSPTIPPPSSPLHWNTSKFSKRDLIELASALYASQAVVDNDGRPISFIQLAQSLASTMNIQFPNNTIYNEREYIRSVKRNTTAFISQLASALSEKSRK